MSTVLEDLESNRPLVAEWSEGLDRARRVMAELVVEAWRGGASLRAIAAASGYSHQRVHQIVRAAADGEPATR